MSFGTKLLKALEFTHNLFYIDCDRVCNKLITDRLLYLRIVSIIPYQLFNVYYR